MTSTDKLSSPMRTVVYAFSLVTAVSLSAAAQQKSLSPVECARAAGGIAFGKPCKLPIADDYTIDAISGNVADSVRFGQSTLIRIVVANVNPFLFSYDVRVNNVLLGEPSPAQFFSMLPFNFTLPQLPAAAPTPAPALTELPANTARIFSDIEMRSAKDGAYSGKCDVVPLKVENILALHDMVFEKDYLGKLIVRTQNDSLPVVSRRMQAQSRRIHNPSADGMEVHLAVVNMVDSLVALQGRLEKDAHSLRAYANTITALNELLVTAIAALPENDLKECSTVLAPVTALMKSSPGDAAKFLTSATSLMTVHTDAERVRQILSSTGEDAQRYYFALLLDRHTTPSDVKIEVVRKQVTPSTLQIAELKETKPAEGADTPATQPPPATTYGTVVTLTTPAPAAEKKEEKKADTPAPAPEFSRVTQTRLNFGGRSRFVIGAGLIFTSLTSHQYSAISRIATPTTTQPNDTMAVVVGPSVKSSNRITPMLTFNTRLIDFRGPLDALYGSIGAGLRTYGGHELDYLAGLGVSALDERVLITGGLYFGQGTVLAGGLNVGDRLPSSATTVPTVNRTVVRLGVGVTYRILPVGSMGPR